MKAFVILSVLFAMANAQGSKVHVVDQPNNGVNVVPDATYYQNPGGNGAGVIDPGFYYNPYHYQGGHGGSNVVIPNPDPYFAGGNGATGAGGYQPGNNVVIPNPDPFFAGGNGATGAGGYQPDGSQYPAHLYPGSGVKPGYVQPGARAGK